jgi:hypothetical protein
MRKKIMSKTGPQQTRAKRRRRRRQAVWEWNYDRQLDELVEYVANLRREEREKKDLEKS